MYLSSGLLSAVNITVLIPDQTSASLKRCGLASVKVFVPNAFFYVAFHSCTLGTRQAQITDRPSELSST